MTVSITQNKIKCF